MIFSDKNNSDATQDASDLLSGQQASLDTNHVQAGLDVIDLRRTALPHGVVLEALPVRNEAVKSERKRQQLILKVPIQKQWYMRPPFAWIMDFRETKNYELDSLGEEVWQQCDGQTSVELIIERFAEKHRLHFHEARASVLSYMQTLAQKRLIAILLPNETVTSQAMNANENKKVTV